jgi:hypothetical protein
LRTKLGKLINAEAADIALTQNATGMNFMANGLDLGWVRKCWSIGRPSGRPLRLGAA